MRIAYKQIYIQVLFILALFSACQKDPVSLEKKKLPPLNALSMQVNNQAWEPGQIGNNECMRTYYGAWSSLDNPFFNIVAYRDVRGRTDINSENSLQIQIMNVSGLGKYELTGSYLESFKSHAIFTVKKPDGRFIRYINKRDTSSFSVVFEEFISLPTTNLKGVKGIFYGTLYNEVDPVDSITITNGNFTFNRTNRYGFDQCD